MNMNFVTENQTLQDYFRIDMRFIQLSDCFIFLETKIVYKYDRKVNFIFEYM